MNSGNIIGRLESSAPCMPAAELDYQARALAEVSRTFALTIPQLPMPLAGVVGNAYLLCRIADTVEDAPELDRDSKQTFAARFVDVVAGRASSESFAHDLAPLLDGDTPAVERDLVANTARVVGVTHGFDPVTRDALGRCVRIMSDGMALFQEAPSRSGLATMADMDRYCYHVAGVVGEMLTTLFCERCAIRGDDRRRMMDLAVDFGQALQMTNILKDQWEDRARGACWLPADVFAAHGQDLGAVGDSGGTDAFRAGLLDLVGIAGGHLERAVTYTTMIPARETGIRRFCLWALGMAVLTLRRIARNPGFTDGTEVKISRRAVKATIITTSASVRSDRLLRGGFRYLLGGLPVQPADYRRAPVSLWHDDVT